MVSAFFLVAHVFANMVWIGAIVSVGWLGAAAARAPNDAEGAPFAQSAVNLYRRVANPAFMVSFVAALGRFLDGPGTYMRLHWFHGKLTAALVVIALHHVIGARTKRMVAPSGSRQAGRSNAILTGATLVCAFLTVMFAILKGALVP